MRQQRRNADEGARRSARDMVTGPTHEMIDRVVLDKIRAGRPGEITIYELHRASAGLIPRTVLEQSFQDSFDRLWKGMPGEISESAQLRIEGADLMITNDSEFGDTFLIMLETSDDTDARYLLGPQFEVPRIRIWINDLVIETNAEGGVDVE